LHPSGSGPGHEPYATGMEINTQVPLSVFHASQTCQIYTYAPHACSRRALGMLVGENNYFLLPLSGKSSILRPKPMSKPCI